MSSASKYDFFSLAGGLAKKMISPVDADFLKRGVLQVLDIKSLSKELVDGILARASKQKDVIVAAIAGEVSQFLNRIDISAELQKLLDDMNIEVHATVELKRRSTGKSAGKFSRKMNVSRLLQRKKSVSPKNTKRSRKK